MSAAGNPYEGMLLALIAEDVALHGAVRLAVGASIDALDHRDPTTAKRELERVLLAIDALNASRDTLLRELEAEQRRRRVRAVGAPAGDTEETGG